MKLKQLGIKFAIGSILTLLFLLFFVNNFGKKFEAQLYDSKFELRGVRDASKDIVIVSIDDVSMDDLDKWPWPREYHATLIDKLKEYGAKVVAFDVVFSNPSGDVEQDEIFATSIKEANNVVLASMLFGGTHSKVASSGGEVDDAMSYTGPDIFEELLGEELNFGLANFDRNNLDKTIRQGRLLYNIYDLVPTSQTINDEFEPHFSLQILKQYDESIYNKVKEKYKNKSFYLNFAGPAKTYRTVSYSNILQDIFLENDVADYSELFKDKIVLVGATAEILHDNFPTPFTFERGQALMPGVEIHAATIDTIMNDLEYKKASGFINNLLVGAIGILATLAFATLSPFLSVGTIFSFGIIYSIINIALFLQFNYWIDWAGPIGVMFVTFAGVYSYRFFIEEKEKRRVRKVFKQYMSPALVEEALKDPEKIPSLDVCSKKFVSILFSDIAGFTTMSEKFPPEEVKRILDEYLTAMTELVFSNDGVLDKYVGDAIMAVYGNVGVIDKEKNAYDVVKTAIEMQEKMGELRQKWVAEGSIAMQIRIGIHSGDALIGNFGSPLKMDYTAIGDTVNTSARLEGLNKEYGTSIMISHSTYELISDRVNVKSLGPAPVKGKSEAIHVYEVLSLAEKGEGKLIEDRNTKQTKWMQQDSNDKQTKWARGSNDTTWK